MLEIKQFTKQYKHKQIANNINIVFDTNKVHYITGPNGTGKTTFLKCLLNMEKYKGEILFNNQTYEEVRNEVEIIYDNSPLYPNLTGYRNISILSQNQINLNELNSNIDQFNLGDILYQKVKHYSYGQRKKLSLIIGLMSNPRYLLLDEITNGLDYDTMILLKQLLIELSKRTTIIVTGHHVEFYHDILDEIYTMNNGNMYKDDIKRKG